MIDSILTNIDRDEAGRETITPLPQGEQTIDNAILLALSTAAADIREGQDGAL